MGEQIKQTRLARKMSQSDLAKLVGTTQPHIAWIEKGTVNVTIDTLGLIASHLAARLTLTPL